MTGIVNELIREVEVLSETEKSITIANFGGSQY